MAESLTRQRGSIYYAQLDGLDEPKAVLIVSWNAINGGLRQPICAMVTSKDRDRALPTYVELDTGDGGVKEPSFVLCHFLVTLKEERLDAWPLGDPLLPSQMQKVEVALARALDFRGANEPLATDVQALEPSEDEPE